jgi:endonuclease-8
LPEGHTVHRTANDFNQLFAGSKVIIDSPQGRFSTDARLITNRKLLVARAIGKQLFLEFDNDLTLRIHLGIYGKWAWHPAGEYPEVVGQIRARFKSAKAIAELRGPTACEILSADEVAALKKRLGPDPLNPDRRGVERGRFVARVLASKQPIGLLLMNQDVIAGIGNVYRAELLYRAGLEPHIPGNQLPQELVEALWVDAVKLLKVGVKTGFMITRDELFTKRPSKVDRNWVYKRQGEPCRRCGTKISMELMASRKLYWCAGCQK